MAAMLIPAISGARRQFNIVQTKAQLQRYALGLESYRAHYGAYPALGESPIEINTTPALFFELLSGHALDGGAPTIAQASILNPEQITFADFTDKELTTQGYVVDSFNNQNIELFFDNNNDGLLDGLSGVRARVGLRSGSITTW